ncbi:MAG: zinc ribbon domain-containing protein [Thaumarchaeota archaeon]|nr:zinc ribbon domain-containing protein [Nitrososphaerota archaeon]
MAAVEPLIALVVLFAVLFAIFFLLIYGIMTFLENANKKKAEPKEAITLAVSGIEQSKDNLSYEKICPKCGTNILAIADYCPECGLQQPAGRRLY